MKKLKEPAFSELIAAYQQCSEVERMKSDRPALTTVWNVVCGVRRLLAATNTSEAAAISELTRQKLDRYLAESRTAGVSSVTAWTYVLHLRGIVARWTLPYYEEMGYKVVPFTLPVCRRKAPRYQRPSRDVLIKVREWYESLLLRSDKRDWVVVTMMIEFAMRNGDIARLRWSDFRMREASGAEGGGGVHLRYTPHKTELTSGRVVSWPVHPEIWGELRRYRETIGERSGTHFQGLVVPAAHEVFARLNKEIRAAKFFTGTSKGLYEFRKICVDHVYQKYGAEMASSISGDDIKTLMRYYADPSQPNIGAVRIVDLL